LATAVPIGLGAAVLLVVDAMTGQDAVNVAEQFAETANFDGVILSKLDGDSRGGAALSVKAVTGKPILYASTGEKLGDFERFHPDRMAQRILGMGDVMTLVEKAERQMDERQAAELEKKIRKEQFTLDDFLEQMQQVRKLGSMSKIMGMLPGMGQFREQLENFDEREIVRTEAIIQSMTPTELELSKSSVNCMPRGVPAIWLQNPYTTYIVHKPGLLVQLYEVLNNWRLVHFDGRPVDLPAIVDESAGYHARHTAWLWSAGGS
jgi:hypothetical protein